MFACRIRRLFSMCVAGLAGWAATALAPSFALAQTVLVDTGPGNASTIGGLAAFYGSPSSYQWLAGRFTLASAETIGKVEAWMTMANGTWTIRLRANDGSNKPGASLQSMSFTPGSSGVVGWKEFSGMNWPVAAGTYWICIEPTTNTGGSATAPIGAPNPLASYAFWGTPNPGYNLLSSSLAFRISTPAPPVPIQVPGDHSTIQAAINAASNGQEIEVAPGTYNEAINFNGKTIKIRKATASGGRARGPTDAVIDATSTNLPAVRIGFGSASGTELDGFTIMGGSALAGAGQGGGVYVSGAAVIIKNCVIVLNQADSGGGVAADLGANATFTTCTILDNEAVTSGGGAYVNGATLNLTDCLIQSNEAGNSGGGINVNCTGIAVVNGCTFVGNTTPNYGGGATVSCSTGNATFTDCTFEDNIAFGGGGAFVSGAAATFTGCDFLNNTASGTGLPSGGGIQATGSTGSLTVNTCWFYSNQGDNGGGIQLLNYSGTTNISNSLFDENTANVFAGGLHVRGSSATVTNCNFTDNAAALGGGISINSGGSLNLAGSSFCGNTPTAVDGTYTDNGGNTLTCPAPGDTNGDNVVNVTDLLIVIGAWGNCPVPPTACPADVTGDGVVNVTDLLLVISNWG